MTQQLLLGAGPGEDDRVRSCCVHLEDNQPFGGAHALWALVFLV